MDTGAVSLGASAKSITAVAFRGPDCLTVCLHAGHKLREFVSQHWWAFEFLFFGRPAMVLYSAPVLSAWNLLQLVWLHDNCACFRGLMLSWPA